MKIAVLYIALGRYDVFWNGFYKSCNKFFIPDAEKTYFVFTDSDSICSSKDIVKIEHKNMGWPNNTLMRFDLFLSIKDKLKDFDYIFFFNANMEFVMPVGHEVLPDEKLNDGLVMGLHPGFAYKQKNEWTYERNPESMAYIPFDSGSHYVQGCINGGTSNAYLKLCKECSKNTHTDLEKGIVAVWHDESHLNKYILDKKPLILGCNYLWPENFPGKKPHNIKIIQRDKSNPKFGGIEFLRGQEKMKYTICYAPDNNYSKLAIVSMVSVLENNKNNEIDFIILYSTLSKQNIDMFKQLGKTYKNCHIKFEKINEKDFTGFPISTWVSVQTWFRTKIAEVCPNVNKALYLDCDTINVAPLEEFFNIDIQNYILAGVPDVWGTENHVKRLAIKDNLYFNAGITMINCKKWREENVFHKIKKYAIENFDILECSDQDVLNKISDNVKLPLHQKFNYMETWWAKYYNEYKGDDVYKYKQASKHPVLIHFTGTKPNNYKCFHSYKKVWWQYAVKTPMFEQLKRDYMTQKNDSRINNARWLLIINTILWKITPKFLKARTKYKNNALEIRNFVRYQKQDNKLKKLLEK